MRSKLLICGLIALLAVPAALRAAPPFVANPGVTGAWFNPSTNGQGFLVELVPNSNLGNLLIVTWYTYAPDGLSSTKAGSDSTFWLTGVGQIGSGNRAQLVFNRSTGGEFDSTQAVSNNNGWATGTWTFNSCESATFTYNLPNVSPPRTGTINLSRVVPDYMCASGGITPIPQRWAGTYRGSWNNLTFNSNGASTMTIANNPDGTFAFSWDLDGQVFGMVDPAPIQFTVDFRRPDLPVTGTDPTFGPYTANFSTDGSFTLTMQPPGFESMQLNGSVSPAHFSAEYTIFAGGMAFANGTVTMWRTLP